VIVYVPAAVAAVLVRTMGKATLPKLFSNEIGGDVTPGGRPSTVICTALLGPVRTTVANTVPFAVPACIETDVTLSDSSIVAGGSTTPPSSSPPPPHDREIARSERSVALTAVRFI
jgi:hypothetical protein